MTVYGPNHIFDFAVIGGGLFGAAAARHLAEAGHDVALLAPPEPEEPSTHRGPFGSHYDEARITRVLDADPLWSRLAQAAIGRYAEIETASGVTFHQPNAYLGIGVEGFRETKYDEPGRFESSTGGADFVAASMQVGAAANATAEPLTGDGIRERFPFLHPGANESGFVEGPPAGHVNPRALARAQRILVEAAGATVLPRTAVTVTDAIDAVDVLTDDATRVLARRALLAAGAYSNDLLIRPLDLEVQARTLVFARLDAALRESLASMPSIIHVPSEAPTTYLLPPVTYPDGETYVKIGVDAWHNPLRTPTEISNWFKSTDGDDEERATADRQLNTLIPSLADAPKHTSTCVYTMTASGYPYVGMVSERLGVAVGGNGKGAKSSDEIGRLGAALLLGEEVDPRLAPRFA